MSEIISTSVRVSAPNSLDQGTVPRVPLAQLTRVQQFRQTLAELAQFPNTLPWFLAGASPDDLVALAVAIKPQVCSDLDPALLTPEMWQFAVAHKGVELDQVPPEALSAACCYAALSAYGLEAAAMIPEHLWDVAMATMAIKLNLFAIRHVPPRCLTLGVFAEIDMLLSEIQVVPLDCLTDKLILDAEQRSLVQPNLRIFSNEFYGFPLSHLSWCFRICSPANKAFITEILCREFTCEIRRSLHCEMTQKWPTAEALTLAKQWGLKDVVLAYEPSANALYDSLDDELG